MEIITDKKVKARKEHKCFFCKGIIEAGETYNYQVNKIDDICTIRTHSNCQELAEKLKLFEDCDNEGLSEDSFHDAVGYEYDMLNNIPRNVYFRKGDIGFVPFKDKLQFVINHYLNK